MSSRLLPFALAILLSGCVSVEMGRLARDVEREVEADGTAELGRGYAIAFGGGVIGTGRFLSRLVAPQSTEPARRLAGYVDQVKVARYPLSGGVDGRRLARPARLDRYEADGWLPMVTARDEGSAVWVLVREDGDQLTDLLAVAVSEEEVVMTRVTGELSALALDAIALGLENQALSGAFSETGIFPDEMPDEPAPAVDA